MTGHSRWTARSSNKCELPNSFRGETFEDLGLLEVMGNGVFGFGSNEVYLSSQPNM